MSICSSLFDTIAAFVSLSSASARNVFNKVNLANPSGCVDCVANGMSAGAVITNLAPNASQRQIEFSLRVEF